jgi:hypothetical protein
MHSERWATFRQHIIDKRGYKCERCGETRPPLQLHHLNYEQLGNEQPADVELLCLDCHEEADEERALHTGAYERQEDYDPDYEIDPEYKPDPDY